MSNFTLITGATGGLGIEFSQALALSNNNLFLTARSQEKLDNLSAKLLEINPKIKVLNFACSLDNHLELFNLFQFIKDNNIKISKLINVAGCDIQKSFEKYTKEKIIFQTRVTYESTVLLTHFALENKAETLEILTISSMCGLMPMPYFAIYSSLKGAIVSFFDSLRVELKNDKTITITTILPGSIPTREDIVEDIKKQGLQGKLSQKSPKYIVEKSLKALIKRKKNYIPGFYNNLINFFQIISPKWIKMKIVARKFSKKEKDAF